MVSMISLKHFTPPGLYLSTQCSDDNGILAAFFFWGGGKCGTSSIVLKESFTLEGLFSLYVEA